jgi:hypothetical protein
MDDRDDTRQRQHRFARVCGKFVRHRLPQSLSDVEVDQASLDRGGAVELEPVKHESLQLVVEPCPPRGLAEPGPGPRHDWFTCQVRHLIDVITRELAENVTQMTHNCTP